MKTFILIVLASALAIAGCGGDSATSPGSTSTTAPFETFTGILGVQGSGFYSFTVSAPGTVSLSVASLTENGLHAASNSTVRLGLGVPLGTGCNVTNFVDTTAGLTTQLTASVSPDIYCVNIADTGTLTGPMDFTIRIAQNETSAPPTGTTVTETFGSFLAIGGTSAHTFTVSQGGTVAMTVTNVTPAATVGLGIGIPAAIEGICSLSRSTDATTDTNPQLTIPIDPGTYCVQLFDDGAVPRPGVAFSMTIAHP
jgi:hypothetical protein